MKSTQSNTTYGPYSPLREADSYVYISGQVGVDPETKIAKVDVGSQTKQVMENIVEVLADANLTLKDVIKTTIYVRNMTDFTEINDIYGSFFTNPYPARACVEVSKLPRVGGNNELLIEIEAVAHRGKTS